MEIKANRLYRLKNGFKFECCEVYDIKAEGSYYDDEGEECDITLNLSGKCIEHWDYDESSLSDWDAISEWTMMIALPEGHKFTTGVVYKTRGGDSAEITDIHSDGTMRVDIYGSGMEDYYTNGKYKAYAKIESAFDLVGLEVDPDDEDVIIAFVVGRSYKTRDGSRAIITKNNNIKNISADINGKSRYFNHKGNYNFDISGVIEPHGYDLIGLWDKDTKTDQIKEQLAALDTEMNAVYNKKVENQKVAVTKNDSNNKKESSKTMATPKKSSTKRSFLNFDFGQSDDENVAVTLNGQLAVKRSEGVFATFQDGDLVETLEEFTLPASGMLFNMPVHKDQLKAGDLIKDGDKVFFVVEAGPKGIKTVDPVNASAHNVVNVKNMFNMNFYTKVSSFMPNIAGGTDGDSSNMMANPMLMMALLGRNEDDEDSSNEAMKMLMMSQAFGGTGGTNAFNPMMLMMMGGKKGGGSDVMTMMAMSQMMSAQQQAHNKPSK